jgi:two-component system, chemotaxis family, response regulator Rcp1
MDLASDSLRRMANHRRTRRVRILLAEDNPGDVRLIREALRESRIEPEIEVARDGVEALEHLHRPGGAGELARPGLILLDLSMPRKDGREVLAEIKADPDLRRIPVVVLTSSMGEEDVVRAYDNHANCYVRKPIDYDELSSVVAKIEDFWFHTVTLPPAP